MNSKQTRRLVLAGIAAAVLVAPLAACSSPEGGGDAEGETSITFLTSNQPVDVELAERLIESFTAANPDIKVTHQTQPAGSEGDNLNKTKLATGEMEDLFYYNSGSLLQALNPDQNLVNLSDEAWVGDLTDAMKSVVSTSEGLYGAPLGASQGGAMLYNKKVYDELGLTVPESWSDFASNNEKIKAAGKTAVIQTFGDDWTSQLFVLGDFANVAAQDAQWADDYTAGKKKFADQPAFQSFANQQEVFDKGWMNENYASALLDDGLRLLATGDGVHFPMLTGTMSTIQQNYPDNVNDIGVFAIPAQNAADTNLTVWLPNAVYIPKTTEGAKLEAAKKFIAFINSPDGCEVQASGATPAGPFATAACSLPSDVPPFLTDMQAYFDAGKSGPALEFLSPIKGPNMPAILVEVGSGIRSAADGAKLYDEDVKKQAQQLGLEGW